MASSPSNPTIPSSSSRSPPDVKSLIREKIWKELSKVAIPDSRFHHDYSSFIPDFTGSSTATSLLTTLPCYKNASTLFIAPDNCLRELRYRALRDGKTVLVTTYGIRRGFYLLDPAMIGEEKWKIPSFLDGMEVYGRHVSLHEIKDLYEKVKIKCMVTGTGAVSSRNGLRFGKGHGFFDLEWGILFELGVVDGDTATLAVCHEVQVVHDVLVGEEWDTGCDFVVTNERYIEVSEARKPSGGILWDRLERGMWEDIEVLAELKGLLCVQ